MNCILFVPYQIRASPADSLPGATCSVLPTAGNGLGYRETQHRAGGPRRAAPGRSVPGFLDAHVGASCRLTGNPLECEARHRRRRAEAVAPPGTPRAAGAEVQPAEDAVLHPRGM